MDFTAADSDSPFYMCVVLLCNFMIVHVVELLRPSEFIYKVCEFVQVGLGPDDDCPP